MDRMRGRMRFKRFFNLHIILLLIVVLTIAAVIFRFLTWGERVNLEDFASEYTDDYKDTLDLILPVVDEDGNIIRDQDDTTTIVCFGNAPFADDRDSEDNLANMIAARTGAVVYNCAISGSYLSTLDSTPYADQNPWDIFSLYWLVQVADKVDMSGHWTTLYDVLGDQMPPEASEVYETLSTLDFDSVDVVAIMYDASDYLAGREMYNDANNTDITQFTGNLEASIKQLRGNHPHIRIIVMSPTYAYATDKDGNYVSSDMYTYGWDVLSTYVIKQSDSCANNGITFIDNIYGTITEDNASEYLIDNLHLNVKGRELVADRFIEALHYYDD